MDKKWLNSSDSVNCWNNSVSSEPDFCTIHSVLQQDLFLLQSCSLFAEFEISICFLLSAFEVCLLRDCGVYLKLEVLFSAYSSLT